MNESIYGLLTGAALDRVRERERELANLAATFYRPGIGNKETRAAVEVVAARADEMLAESIEAGESFDFNLSGYALADAIVSEAFTTLDLARWTAHEAVDCDSSKWSRVDVVEAGLNPPSPPDVFGLFYCGQRHVLIGEGGAGKTWLAAAAIADELAAGFAAVLIDSDGTGAAQVYERLHALGVDDEAIRNRLYYFEPDAPPAEATLSALVEMTEAGTVRLVVVDSFDPLLALHGLDPNSTVDVDNLLRAFARPLAAAGAAVVFLDHVVKSNDQRGTYAIGSQRKQTGPEVNLIARVVEPLGRGLDGRLRIIVGKDRVGYLGPKGSVVGFFKMSSDAEDGTCVARMSKVKRGDSFRPTGYMERVSIELEGRDEPASIRSIREAIGGRSSYVTDALEVLKVEGYVSEEEGPRSSRLFTSLNPYREDDDEDADAPVPTGSRPVPDEHEQDTTATGSPLPLPIGEAEPERVTEDTAPVPVKVLPVPEPDLSCVMCNERESMPGRVVCEECDP